MRQSLIPQKPIVKFVVVAFESPGIWQNEISGVEELISNYSVPLGFELVNTKQQVSKAVYCRKKVFPSTLNSSAPLELQLTITSPLVNSKLKLYAPQLKVLKTASVKHQSGAPSIVPVQSSGAASTELLKHCKLLTQVENPLQLQPKQLQSYKLAPGGKMVQVPVKITVVSLGVGLTTAIVTKSSTNKVKFVMGELVSPGT